MAIRVLVNGGSGKMGQEVVKAIQTDKALELVGTTDVHDNLSAAIKKLSAQIVVDFTSPHAVYENTKMIIANGAHPVIGTTGLQPNQISELQKLSKEKKLGGIIAPNFSIGAVLMMKFAQEAAKYYNHAEIIELHHNAKADAPSGTAIKTAEMIIAIRKEAPALVEEKSTLPHARGANHHDIHIHAIRLPGIVANQEVIFGGTSETLKISHTTIHREAFMPGVLLACKKAPQLHELIYGLEHIL